jgi:hypothetical protein
MIKVTHLSNLVLLLILNLIRNRNILLNLYYYLIVSDMGLIYCFGCIFIDRLRRCIFMANVFLYPAYDQSLLQVQSKGYQG